MKMSIIQKTKAENMPVLNSSSSYLDSISTTIISQYNHRCCALLAKDTAQNVSLMQQKQWMALHFASQRHFIECATLVPPTRDQPRPVSETARQALPIEHTQSRNKRSVALKNRSKTGSYHEYEHCAPFEAHFLF